MSKMMYYNTRITTDTVICCKQDVNETKALGEGERKCEHERVSLPGLHAPLVVLINCLKCFGAFITLNV